MSLYLLCFKNEIALGVDISGVNESFFLLFLVVGVVGRPSSGGLEDGIAMIFSTITFIVHNQMPNGGGGGGLISRSMV